MPPARTAPRPVILISNVGLGLDYVVMALAPSLYWLFLGRVISGITAASISTSYAYVADVTPPGERAARFGLLGRRFRDRLRARPGTRRAHLDRHAPLSTISALGRHDRSVRLSPQRLRGRAHLCPRSGACSDAFSSANRRIDI
jgi:Major Facilitator Superfamily